MGDAVLQPQRAADAVKAEALALLLAQARQALQAEQVDDAQRVHVDRRDAAAAQVQPHVAAQRVHVDRDRRTAPAHRAGQRTGTVLDQAGMAEVGQHAAQVVGFQAHVERDKAACGTAVCARGLTRLAPQAAAEQVAMWHAGRQLVDAPAFAMVFRLVHQRCPGHHRRTGIASQQGDAVELVAEHIDLFRLDIERRQGFRVFGARHQVTHILHDGRLDDGARQAGLDAAGPLAVERLQVFHVAVDLACIQRHLPQAAMARATQHQIVEAAIRHRQRGGLDRHHAGQVVQAGFAVARRTGGGRLAGRDAIQHGDPVVGIHVIEQDQRVHIVFGQRRQVLVCQRAGGDTAAQHAWRVATHIAHVMHRQPVADAHQQLVLGRHQLAALLVLVVAHDGVLVVQRQALAGALAQRCRQVHRHADQVAVDGQLRRATIELQARAVGAAAFH